MIIGHDDRYHEECGVVGIWAPGQPVSNLTYFGLFAIQHRGQEACGMAVMDDSRTITFHKDCGLVSEVFSPDKLSTLVGKAAIGHVRYGTTGNNSPVNAQPMVGACDRGQLALAHNGNLANTEALRARLAERGAVFQSTTDTEVVLHLLARDGLMPLEKRFLRLMDDLEGSYAFVALNQGSLYAARDPRGCRPMCLGRLGDGYVVASESCVLTTIGATFIRDVKPGEVLRINEKGLTSFMKSKIPEPAHCVFEYVYFARPDSTLDGINVNRSRRAMGEQLAKQVPHLEVDAVIPVPDSGTTAALGLAQALGIPMKHGILKNRYAGRTFIQPTQALRETMVNLKLNPIEEEISGLRLAVVDDSIVRGTTSRRLIARLREKGAKEVHLLVTCPPVKHPCYYGIDTGDESTLIARRLDEKALCEYLNADSLTFLQLPGLLEAVGGAPRFCTACLTGCYPCGHPHQHATRCGCAQHTTPDHEE